MRASYLKVQLFIQPREESRERAEVSVDRGTFTAFALPRHAVVCDEAPGQIIERTLTTARQHREKAVSARLVPLHRRGGVGTTCLRAEDAGASEPGEPIVHQRPERGRGDGLDALLEGGGIAHVRFVHVRQTEAFAGQ